MLVLILVDDYWGRHYVLLTCSSGKNFWIVVNATPPDSTESCRAGRPRSGVGKGERQLTAPLGNIPHLAVPAVNLDALQSIQVRGNDAPAHEGNLVIVLHVDVV